MGIYFVLPEWMIDRRFRPFDFDFVLNEKFGAKFYETETNLYSAR